MDFGEKREVGREILSLSNLLYRKIEYDKKKSGIYDLQYVQGGIIKYIKENPQKDIFPRDIVKRFCLTRSTVAGILQKMEQNGYIEMQSDGSLTTDEYMTILVQFPSETFNCKNKINKNFDYYLDMANEGSTQYSASPTNYGSSTMSIGRSAPRAF